MGDMTIRIEDDDLVRRLAESAARVDRDPATLAIDMVAYQLSAGPPAMNDRPPDTLTAEERIRRRDLIDDLRAIRAMTLKPLVFDSTLIVREMRDRDD